MNTTKKLLSILMATSITLAGCDALAPGLQNTDLGKAVKQTTEQAKFQISKPHYYNKLHQEMAKMEKLGESLVLDSVQSMLSSAAPMQLHNGTGATWGQLGLVVTGPDPDRTAINSTPLSSEEASLILTEPDFTQAFQTMATADQLNKALEAIPEGTFPMQYLGVLGYKLQAQEVKRDDPADRTHISYAGGPLDTLNMEFWGTTASTSNADGKDFNLFTGLRQNNDGIRLWGNPPLNTSRFEDIKKWAEAHPEEVAAIKEAGKKISETAVALAEQNGKGEQVQQAQQIVATVKQIAEAAAAAENTKEEIKNTLTAQAPVLQDENLQQVLDLLQQGQDTYATVGFGTPENPTDISYEFGVVNRAHSEGTVSLDVLVKSLNIKFPFDPDIYSNSESGHVTSLRTTIDANCTDARITAEGQVVLAFGEYDSLDAVAQALRDLVAAWEGNGEEFQVQQNRDRDVDRDQEVDIVIPTDPAELCQLSPFCYDQTPEGKYRIIYTYYMDVERTVVYNEFLNSILGTLDPESDPVAPLLTCENLPEERPSAEPTAPPTFQPDEPAEQPAPAPTATPTATPTSQPTATPTATPTSQPTATPTATPTSQPTATPTATPTPQPQTHSITFDGNAFSTGNIGIKNSDTVTWTNQSNLVRLLRSEESLFSDQSLSKTGGSFSHTFSQSGTFTFKIGTNAMTVTVN